MFCHRNGKEHNKYQLGISDHRKRKLGFINGKFRKTFTHDGSLLTFRYKKFVSQFGVFVLDYFFDWELIKDAIVEKPYVLVGFSALLILATLTATSTKGWKLRLKRNWKRLHRLVYVAGILVILHYTWLVKADIREPLVYGAFIAVFLIIRVPFVRDRLIKARESRTSQQVQS